MNPALDKNGNQIIPNRLALRNDGRCFVIVRLEEYRGNKIVLMRPLKEESYFPIGLTWSHHPHKELIMLSEQETTFLLLKHKIYE